MITYTINSSSKYRINEWSEKGSHAEEAIIKAIVSGQIDGTIDNIVSYDPEPDEGWARYVTEDIAIAIAKRLDDTQSVPPQLHDFIETHAGSDYLQGLRRRETTFAAE